MKNLSLTLTALALVAGLAAVALSVPVTSTVPDVAPTSLSLEAPSEMPLLGEDGCDAADPLEAPGTEMACCLDQCQVDSDCFFRCGGQPGQCVMNNPCCTECECGAVSSFAS